MNRTLQLLTVILGIGLLGGLGMLLGAWAAKWPRVHRWAMRVGNIAVNIAIGALVIWFVLFVFRSIGWLPSSN